MGYRTENNTLKWAISFCEMSVFRHTIFDAEIYAFYTSVTNAGSNERKEKC